MVYGPLKIKECFNVTGVRILKIFKSEFSNTRKFTISVIILLFCAMKDVERNMNNQHANVLVVILF